MVGLDANEEDAATERQRETGRDYSEYVKGQIRREVRRAKVNCLSNLVKPVARCFREMESAYITSAGHRVSSELLQTQGLWKCR